MISKRAEQQLEDALSDAGGRHHYRRLTYRCAEVLRQGGQNRVA